MRRFRSLIALLLVAVMLSTTAFAVQFPDVDPNSTVGKAVDYLSNLGVLGGYEDGTFKPDATVTRAQFAKIVYMMENQGTSDPNADAYKGNSAFIDVSANQWFSGYVNWAYQRKIIGGMGDGTFQPDGTLTYAQAIKMYVVAAGVDDSGYSYPNDYIAKANELGILNNVYYGHPDDGASRGNIAVMGYNKLTGGAPAQKADPYRLCAQAPDFGKVFGVNYIAKSENSEALIYFYDAQPGVDVRSIYAQALLAYGYQQEDSFIDSSGELVDAYSMNGYVVMYSVTAEETIVMVLFPEFAPGNPFVSQYYVEWPSVRDFGTFARVPLYMGVFDEDYGAYYYSIDEPNYSSEIAAAYCVQLESDGFTYLGTADIGGVEKLMFDGGSTAVTVGFTALSGGVYFEIMIVDMTSGRSVSEALDSALSRMEPAVSTAELRSAWSAEKR